MDLLGLGDVSAYDTNNNNMKNVSNINLQNYNNILGENIFGLGSNHLQT